MYTNGTTVFMSAPGHAEGAGGANRAQDFYLIVYPEVTAPPQHGFQSIAGALRVDDDTGYGAGGDLLLSAAMPLPSALPARASDAPCPERARDRAQTTMPA